MPSRNNRNFSRRSRTPNWILGSFVLLLLASAGMIGTLWLAGFSLLPRPQIDDPFMVRIPVNALPIPAYSRVDRSHLLDPAGGGILYQKVPPQSVIGMSIVGIDTNGSHIESRVNSIKNMEDEVVFVVSDGAEVRQANTLVLGGAIMNVNSILGRVVRADKRAGLGFQEGNFFPQGTPEGLAGATPPGMRSITLDATKLTGVHALNAGDLIDLLASMPISEDASQGGPTEVRLLAQKATVLRPVYIRNEVSESSSLMSGKTTSTAPKYEVAIAVDAEDVIPLQNAINEQLSITCVAHSMRPLSSPSQPTVADNEDEVQVPVTVRPLLAYEVVSRDAFVSPATRMLKTELISRQLADRTGAITSLDEALGAITRQDIPEGRYLRHSDLLKGPPSENNEDEREIWSSKETSESFHPNNATELVSMVQQAPPTSGADNPPTASTASGATAVGDRPAITSFIPPGRTAFAIPLNRIYGAEHLQIGDSLDLLASFSLEREQVQEETETRPDGTVIVRKSDALTPRTTQRTWEETFGNRAEPWFIASNALVVAPVGFPAPAAALRAIQAVGGSGATTATRPGARNPSGPAVIIAVESRDVEAVVACLATQDALFTVAFHASNQVRPSERFKVIALAPESIAAYSELNETTWHGNRRDVVTRRVSIDDPRFIHALSPSDLSQYYGRVLKYEKKRGAFFEPTDFFPDGIAQGIAAAARVGFSLLPIADSEIEGLDAFSTNDNITILMRRMTDSPLTVSNNSAINSASSLVIVPVAKVVRASTAGQSVIEVSNEHLTKFQSALALSLSDQNAFSGRSLLIAVGAVRQTSASDDSAANAIRPFNPSEHIKKTQIFVGGRRTTEFFDGGTP